MRVCLVPCDFDGSGCYRLLFPAAELRERFGWECAMPPHSSRVLESGVLVVNFDRIDVSLPAIDADLYVFQRPVDLVVPNLIRELQGLGKRVVVETDDWYAGVPAWNPAHKKLNVKFSPSRNTRVFAECVGIADALTVSTPFLGRAYAKYAGGDVTVLPNYLLWSMWDHPPVYERKDWEGVRVGYMGDARWHSGDLKVLVGLIGPWLERNPDVKFVAQPDALELLEVPDAQRVVMGKVAFRDLTLRSITATMDIGLVPLASHDFNEGKSYLKGMEYAACGIPCVASNTESYRYWVDHGQNGFLARRPRDFVRHLNALVGDADLRRRMGARAREKAREHTIDRHADQWADCWARVAGREAVAA